MKKAVVVFRSKTEVFEFIEALAEKHIVAGTTGTPKEARIGCGIAADLEIRHLPVARSLVRSKNFKGYYGIFIIEKINNRVSTIRVD